MFTNTISARELQTGYRKVLHQAEKTNEPIVVITNNKPVGAIISLDLLKRLDDMRVLNEVVREAKAEYKAGKTKKITNFKDLLKDLQEMETEAKT